MGGWLGLCGQGGEEGPPHTHPSMSASQAARGRWPRALPTSVNLNQRPSVHGWPEPGWETRSTAGHCPAPRGSDAGRPGALPQEAKSLAGLVQAGNHVNGQPRAGLRAPGTHGAQHARSVRGRRASWELARGCPSVRRPALSPAPRPWEPALTIQPAGRGTGTKHRTPGFCLWPDAPTKQSPQRGPWTTPHAGWEGGSRVCSSPACSEARWTLAEAPAHGAVLGRAAWGGQGQVSPPPWCR